MGPGHAAWDRDGSGGGLQVAQPSPPAGMEVAAIRWVWSVGVVMAVC